MKDLNLHNVHTTILILKCWMSDSLSMDYGECSILVFFVNIFLHLNLNMVNFETEADIMLRSHSDINDAITNHSVCSRCHIPKSLLYKWCYNKLIVFSRYHSIITRSQSDISKSCFCSKCYTPKAVYYKWWYNKSCYNKKQHI